jgi:hypothetical protein
MDPQSEIKSAGLMATARECVGHLLRTSILSSATKLKLAAGKRRDAVVFKANPYLLFGQPRPGKIHGLRKPNDTEEEFVTLCGLTPARCPGKLIDAGDDQITCKVCRNKLNDAVKWYCRSYDGIPEWMGYAGGEKRYRIYNGCWEVISTGEGGSCSDIEEGKARCLEHYLSARRESS